MTQTHETKRFLPVAVLSAIATLTLAGCQMPERNAQVVASPDKVSLMLAEAADKASSSLEALAAIEQKKSPGVAVAPINNVPEELARAIIARAMISSRLGTVRLCRWSSISMSRTSPLSRCCVT